MRVEGPELHCKVGYLYDIKASSLDTAIYSGFTAAIKGSPVQVVTSGQSFFTPTTGETAVQTMLLGRSRGPERDHSGPDQGAGRAPRWRCRDRA